MDKNKKFDSVSQVIIDIFNKVDVSKVDKSDKKILI